MEEELINPFRSLRLKEGLTLGELSAYAKVDIRALTRSEHGMYTNPLPGLVDYWVGKGRISEGILVSEYEDYQIGVRRHNHLLFGPSLDFSANSNIHPFRQLRARGPFTLTECCKALCVPLDTVQYFEKKWRTQIIVPKGVINALNQAGYSRPALRGFTEAYASWRSNHSTITFS